VKEEKSNGMVQVMVGMTINFPMMGSVKSLPLKYYLYIGWFRLKILAFS
jgi:hypothetical protein